MVGLVRKQNNGSYCSNPVRVHTAGNIEEAAAFAEIVCQYGFRTLSIDLPGHGERKDEKHILPEGQSALCGLAFFVFGFSLLKNALRVFI